MYVVMQEYFDPDLHSVWGPFQTNDDAQAWRDRQPDRYRLVVRELANPSDPL
jgi:hypothetical protein